MSVWLHIGSAPSVIETLPRVLDEWECDVVMTCNSGIKLFPVPNYYFAVDGQSSVRFYEEALAAQAGGCALVTLYRKSEVAVHDRKVGHYNEFIDIPARAPVEFDGKNYSQFRFTGPLCLQYAVLHGATTVVMVGCDGWSGSLEKDYFDHVEDGFRKRESSAARTHEVLAPQFRSVASASPHVRFVRYGEPVFQVGNENWEER